MLIIRKDKRVADIYLGEFMRLFNHFYFRYIAKKFNQPDEVTGKRGYLTPDDTWRKPYYLEGTAKYIDLIKVLSITPFKVKLSFFVMVK
jgi:hypothetical protein